MTVHGDAFLTNRINDIKGLLESTHTNIKYMRWISLSDEESRVITQYLLHVLELADSLALRSEDTYLRIHAIASQEMRRISDKMFEEVL